MAYDSTKLRRVEGSPGSALYTYIQATDAIATMVGSGYFNSGYTDYGLTTGDIIIAADTDTPTVDVLLVAESSGTVTTTNGT